MQETWTHSLGPGNPLEEEMASPSSILAWKVPWAEEPGRLQPTGWQRIGHDTTHTHFMVGVYRVSWWRDKQETSGLIEMLPNMCLVGTSLAIQWLDFTLPLQGVWIPSYIPCDMAKKKKKLKKCIWLSSFFLLNVPILLPPRYCRIVLPYYHEVEHGHMTCLDQ